MVQTRATTAAARRSRSPPKTRRGERERGKGKEKMREGGGGEGRRGERGPATTTTTTTRKGGGGAGDQRSRHSGSGEKQRREGEREEEPVQRRGGGRRIRSKGADEDEDDRQERGGGGGDTAQYAPSTDDQVRRLVDLLCVMLEANREDVNRAAKRNRWIKTKAQRLFQRYHPRATGERARAGATSSSDLRGRTHVLTIETKRVPRLLEDQVVENHFGGWDRVPDDLKEETKRTHLKIRARRRAQEEGGADADGGTDFDKDERVVRDLMQQTVRGRGRTSAGDSNSSSSGSGDEDDDGW